MQCETAAYTLAGMKIGERIKEARRRKGLSQHDLAKLLGISRGAVGNWEKKNANNPETDRLPTLAKALGVSMAYLTGEAEFDEVDEPSNVTIAENLNLDYRNRQHDNIPIYGTARGGAGGSFELNAGEVIERRTRPAGLRDKGDIFGLYVEGESMVPRYDPGELILCWSKRPVIIGRDIVIEMKIHAEGENPRAYLKRLVSRNSETITVEQLNPPKRQTFKMSQVESLHLVLLRSEMV